MQRERWLSKQLTYPIYLQSTDADAVRWHVVTKRLCRKVLIGLRRCHDLDSHGGGSEGCRLSWSSVMRAPIPASIVLSSDNTTLLLRYSPISTSHSTMNWMVVPWMSLAFLPLPGPYQQRTSIARLYQSYNMGSLQVHLCQTMPEIVNCT